MSSPTTYPPRLAFRTDTLCTDTIGNRVFSILLGDAIHHSLIGTKDPHYYNHYSEIATVEANWDLHTLGRWDVGANVFDFVGKKTGDHIRPQPQVTGANETVFRKPSETINYSYNQTDMHQKIHPTPGHLTPDSRALATQHPT